MLQGVELVTELLLESFIYFILYILLHILHIRHLAQNKSIKNGWQVIPSMYKFSRPKGIHRQSPDCGLLWNYFHLTTACLWNINGFVRSLHFLYVERWLQRTLTCFYRQVILWAVLCSGTSNLSTLCLGVTCALTVQFRSVILKLWVFVALSALLNKRKLKKKTFSCPQSGSHPTQAEDVEGPGGNGVVSWTLELDQRFWPVAALNSHKRMKGREAVYCSEIVIMKNDVM